MILNKQNLSENNWNPFKIVPQGHNHCQLSIVNCQFGEAAKSLFNNPLSIESPQADTPTPFPREYRVSERNIP